MSSVFVATNAVANPIDAEKAKSLAQEYLVPGHTMTLVKTVARNEVKARNLSAAVKATSPYYVYSRGENKGFVIVAGDDCLPTILGYTEQGNWDDNTVPPALAEMLECYASAVENAQADGTNVPMDNEAKLRKAAATKVDIAPLVSSHWHQSSPYNDNCPVITSNGNKALTGCVATAASQILYYWRKDLPSTLQSTTPTYGYGDAPVTRSVPKGTPLKWDLMKDSYSGSEPADIKDAVAEFVFATGAATWLTYGSSTSGNIEKIPYTFSTYFGMNGGTVYYRDSYSQSGWSNLIYNELINGRPVMYTGVHPDNGGHAVFIHGYKASSDLFYFNFGCGAGNGYDGYYTTNQTNGMNGFNSYQSALIGASPKTRNMKVTITPPEVAVSGSTNKFKVTIENNSTLPLNGVYLFTSTSSSKPTSLSNAKDEDTDVTLASGDSYTYELGAKFVSSGKYYITVADANLTVLGYIQINVVAGNHEFALNSTRVLGTTEKETYDGQDYTVIYNDDKATVALNITNNNDVSYESTMRYVLYSKDKDAAEWDEGTTKSTSNLSIPANSTSTQLFNILSLNKDKLYKVVVLKSSNTALSTYEMEVADDNDATVYFTLKGTDMAVESYEDGVIKCTGHYDYYTLSGYPIMKSNLYKAHTAIDLTKVVGIEELPDNSVNPNALYYVADDAVVTGKNVVKAGKCAKLSLVPGYNFVPVADFTADEAVMSIGDRENKWDVVTVPFDAQVPDGIIARNVESHKSSGITNATTDVKTLEAGKTYIVMASSLNTMSVYGNNVEVKSAPQTNTDAAFVGTYVNTALPASSFVINYDDVQYFVPVSEGTELEALRGYFCTTDIKNSFRAYSNILFDPAYLVLASAISQSYDILESYKGYVVDGSYDDLLAKIHEAEKEFSNRTETELTSGLLVRSYAQNLLDEAEKYKMCVRSGVDVNIDCTSSIVNPSFELSSSYAKGWTLGTTKDDRQGSTVSKIASNKANAYLSVGVDGNNFFNSQYIYNDEEVANDSLGVELSQSISGLLPGVYRLSAMVGTSTGRTVTVFANDKATEVKAHSFGFRYLTEAVVDDVVVEADKDDVTGTLTFGVKAGSWYKVDNFHLVLVKALQDAVPLAIEDVTSEVADSERNDDIYTILGIKVANASHPGVYIINGKKVVVK